MPTAKTKITSKKVAGMPVWAIGAAVAVGLVIFFVLRRRGSSAPSNAVEPGGPSYGGAPPSAGSGSPAPNAAPSVDPGILAQLAGSLGDTLGGVSQAALYSSSAAVQQAMVSNGEIVNSAFAFGASQAAASYQFASETNQAAFGFGAEALNAGATAIGSAGATVGTLGSALAGAYSAIGGNPGAAVPAVTVNVGGTTVQSATTPPRKYSTYQSQVQLGPGQTVHYTPGKGYYAQQQGVGAHGEPLAK